jgi:hypothetical protein
MRNTLEVPSAAVPLPEGLLPILPRVRELVLQDRALLKKVPFRQRMVFATTPLND